MAISSPFAKLPFKTKGYITLAGGFLIHFILGTFYLWGNMGSYIASYLQNDGQDYTNNDVGAVFPFMMLAINIGILFGVTIAKKIGFRLLCLICSFFIGVGIFTSSFALKNFALFTFLYGFVFGVFNGLAYMLPFNLCYTYFPEKKGIVSGVIAGAFGLGAAVWIWLVNGLINPDNIDPIHTDPNDSDSPKYYPASVTDNLPRSIRIFAIVYFSIATFGSLLIEEPTKEELQQIEEEQNAQFEKLIDGYEQHKEVECENLKDGLKTRLIYITFGLAAMYASFGAMLVANYKNYGLYLNFSSSFLSIVSTVGSISNGLSRFFWGAVYQKVPFKWIAILNLSLQCVISFTLRWASQVEAVYLIYITFMYFLYGGWYAVLPATITKIYGKKIGNIIYGVTFSGFTIAGFFQFFVVTKVQTAIGWGNMFWVFTGVQLLAIIFTFFVKFEINWKERYAALRQKDEEFEYSSKSLDTK
ncbi:MFS transporter (macronuclear) [Tetrahymena thermophila SB210]|uniref:MFS transporter n=1 Tax=Tetrahymena thermophila (strain SB210) TaxID=312017 RepID=Q245X5_TETTS|nr:MFS transporter [Tetrahymena thermophila SB210]EAS03508.1 MFS transporter [Tetrahymena thermophila SB210]|eukprot:XP_001023753.1 MFS transporter [Tetrahymena thermophila SB210]